MFWREVSPDELAAIKTARENRDDTKRSEVLELCRENGKPFASGEELVKAIVAKGIAKKTKAHNLINSCRKRNELVTQDWERGNGYTIGLPEQMHS